MIRQTFLQHEFVEYIPEDLQEGVIYISISFATAVHKCCCGCKSEVVTPISPTDWKLIFDGESITLDPSIGNWNFPCSSHYWIRRNHVQWAPKWSHKEIQAGRSHDQKIKKQYFEGEDLHNITPTVIKEKSGERGSLFGLWQKLKNWLRT
jgi:hypothetical protein